VLALLPWRLCLLLCREKRAGSRLPVCNGVVVQCVTVRRGVGWDGVELSCGLCVWVHVCVRRRGPAGVLAPTATGEDGEDGDANPVAGGVPVVFRPKTAATAAAAAASSGGDTNVAGGTEEEEEKKEAGAAEEDGEEGVEEVQETAGRDPSSELASPHAGGSAAAAGDAPASAGDTELEEEAAVNARVEAFNGKLVPEELGKLSSVGAAAVQAAAKAGAEAGASAGAKAGAEEGVRVVAAALAAGASLASPGALERQAAEAGASIGAQVRVRASA
jgi:hypothetical protein